MNMMSVRELNANVSRAQAAAETGEDIVLTRNGKPYLRITREGVDGIDANRRSALSELLTMMDDGIDFGGPASYDERTGR